MQILDGAGWKIRARLYARKTVESCEDANRQAVWVLAVADGIIAGHNGILTHDQALALNAWMKLKPESMSEASTSERLEPSSVLLDDQAFSNAENARANAANEHDLNTEPALVESQEAEPQQSASPLSESLLVVPGAIQPEEPVSAAQ